MLVGVIGLAEGLLPRHLVGRAVHVGSLELGIGVDVAAVVEALLLFFGALLEENFAEHVFFLLVGVVILDVIIVRLIKNAVRIMIAVGVLVSYPPRLAHGRVGVQSVQAIARLHAGRHLSVGVVLAGYQKDSLMETTNDRDLGLRLRTTSVLL